MADDNEFLSRKERNERIKNIEYQIEDENAIAVERKQKEKVRRERVHKSEAQKEQARAENAEKQAKVAEEEQQKKKTQQQEARDIMEKKRQSKIPKGKADVTRTSTDEQIKNSTATVSASNLAKDNVLTDIYVDGKKVSERDLTQDLVKQIRQEQANATRQTENEIKDAEGGASNNNVSEGTNSVQNKTERAILNNKLRNSGGKHATSTGGAGNRAGVTSSGAGFGLNGIPAFGVDVKSSKPTEIGAGKYGSTTKGTSKDVNNNNKDPMLDDGIDPFSDPSNRDNTTNGRRDNTIVPERYENANNSDNPVIPEKSNTGNRDTLKADLSKLNGDNSKNSKKNDDQNTQNQNNTNSKKGDSAKNAGIFMGAGAGMTAGMNNPSQNRANPLRRTPSPQAGGPVANGPDLDAQLSNRMVTNAGRMSRMAGSAYSGAKSIFNATKTAMKVGKVLTLGPLVGIVGGGVLSIILVAGGASFIMNMPGMVRDKIVDIWDDFWQEAKGLVVGQAQPTPAAVKGMAEYLENMGLDLEYNGFVTKLEKDDDGNIKDIESKYLSSYLAAEQRSYLIANENYNLVGIWEGIKGLLPGNTAKDYWGTGMILLEEKAFETLSDGLGFANGAGGFLADIAQMLTDYFLNNGKERGAEVRDASALTKRVSIKRDTKEMLIGELDVMDAWNTGGYDVYRYSLKEWTEKYGTPTELFLTLHLSTRAPEFAYKFANTYDTKVFINIKELTNVDLTLVYAKTDQEGKAVLDDKGKPIMIPVSEMSDEDIKAKGGITNEALAEMRKLRDRITAFTPYITKVLNHWYYQQIIYQGEYKGKKIDVYKIESLAEGDEGYLRYYAYTRRKNDDAGAIEKDSEKVKLASNSTFWSVYNVIAKIVANAMTGGYDGISGLMEGVSEAALNEAYGMLQEAVVSEISNQIKEMLPDQLAGMLNVNDFLKGNLSLDQLERLSLSGINLGNMTEFLDFDKITGYLNIDNLKLDVNKMWDQLNIKDELLNMDLAGLGSINDLSGVINNLDMSNLNDVFSKNFGEMLDLSNVNFDKLTNQLVGGFSSSIEEMQKSIVGSCDILFSGLSDMDFNKISDRMLGDVTKQLSDLSSGQIIDQLTDPIKNIVEGKFNGEILSGLQNEFSKQLTGLSYKDLGNLANIPGLDFDQLKNLSGQVTDISSALKVAGVDINNLTVNINKISRDLTGMDAKVLDSVSNGLKNFDNIIDTSKLEILETQKLLGSLTSTSDITDLKNKVTALENKFESLKSVTNQLDVEKLNILQGEIDAYKRDIVNTASKLENLDKQVLKNVQSKISNLENKATNVVDNITSLDIKKIEALKYKVKDLDKTGLVDLATNFAKLDVANNGMDKLVRQYGDNITGLKTSEINAIMNTINGQNIDAQGAINGISKYLLKADESGLVSNLNKLDSTVKSLVDATTNFDVNKVATIVNKVPGFDSLHLNNIASQLSGLENVSVDQLLNKVEELPNQLVNQVSEQLTQKITEGVKDQVSQNLSEKLKGNMLNSGTFSGDLKAAMTGGEKQDMDMETEDHAIKNPYAEYSTGFYVREIRHADYFQKAEPLRVLYSTNHWRKMFMEDKYVILDTPAKDMNKIDDEEYIEKYGKTIYQATDGKIESGIYAMLQSIQSSESQYLFRYFKELFNDMSWGVSSEKNPLAVNPKTISWIFRTVEQEEPDFVGNVKELKQEVIYVEEKEYKEKIDSIISARKPAEAAYYIHEAKYVGNYITVLKDVEEAYKTEEYRFDRDTKDEVIREKVNQMKESDTTKIDCDIKVDVSEDTKQDIIDAETDEDYIDAARSGAKTNEKVAHVTFYKMVKKEVEEPAPEDKRGKYEVIIKYFKYESEENHMVEKAEYEPYTWSTSKIGIINPKSIDPVYGFKPGIDIVAPANGVVVAKTEARKNELGEKVAQSITIELRDTGDANADGMRIILIGGDYSSVMVGSLVNKETYSLDDDGKYTGGTEKSIIGKTTNEAIKIMVLDKDQTPVNDVSEFIYPPYQQYKPQVGDGKNERKQ